MIQKDNLINTIRYSFRTSIPVMAGYFVLGSGFSLLYSSKGLPWYFAVLMSFIVYGGSMQYIAVDLLSSGASFISVAITSIVVNFRQIFYGLSMLNKYKGIGKRKPYLAFALTDETFSLLCQPKLPENVNEKDYDLFVSLFNQSYWILGTIIGLVLQRAFKFNTAGVEFSMTSLFVVIFIEQWEKTKCHIPALTGVIITTICLLIFGRENFLIPAMGLITVALFFEKNKLEGNENG